jgi:hypothetical protein
MAKLIVTPLSSPFIQFIENYYALLGTTNNFFQIDGNTGPGLAADIDGNLQALNANETAYVEVAGADPTGPNDFVTLEYAQANFAPIGDVGPGSNVLPGSIDAILMQKFDGVSGTVTGLSATPTHVTGQVLYEEGVTVQSGMNYLFSARPVTSGFTWNIKVLGDEYWPGPGPVTLKVDYFCSAS